MRHLTIPRVVVALAAMAAVMCAPSVTEAQGSCSRSNSGSCSTSASSGNVTEGTIAKAVQAVITAGSTASITATAAAYNAGYAEFQGATLTVRANKAWNLTISSSASAWTNVGSGSRASKPVADLSWATSQAGTYTALSATATTVTSGAAATSGTTVNLWHRAKLSWTSDTPGTYILPVTVTLTAP
jgi:hypothetical protein